MKYRLTGHHTCIVRAYMYRIVRAAGHECRAGQRQLSYQSCAASPRAVSCLMSLVLMALARSAPSCSSCRRWRRCLHLQVGRSFSSLSLRVLPLVRPTPTASSPAGLLPPTQSAKQGAGQEAGRGGGAERVAYSAGALHSSLMHALGKLMGVKDRPGPARHGERFKRTPLRRSGWRS